MKTKPWMMLVAIMAGWINARRTNLTIYRFTVPLLPHSISNCQDYQIDPYPIIVQTGQTPLSQQEDRSGDNSGQGENHVFLHPHSIPLLAWYSPAQPTMLMCLKDIVKQEVGGSNASLLFLHPVRQIGPCWTPKLVNPCGRAFLACMDCIWQAFVL